MIGRNTLYITRGDSYNFTLTIEYDNGEKYALKEGDIIYFSVKKQIRSREYSFQKIIKNFIDGDARIEITPEDTKHLQFGQYVYDVQLTKSNGTIKTIIKPSELTIGEEVTDE